MVKYFMISSNQIISYLKALANPEIAEHSQRFFKTAKGEYGYGDKFLGIRVPIIRQTVKHFKTASLAVIEELLSSQFHEVRLFAVLHLVYQFKKSSLDKKETIYFLYLNNTQYINNWDLVDSSAHHIVGPFLETKDRSKLYQLAKSELLWERRIAIIATYYYIKQNDFNDTLAISKQLLNDSEDLIHKAVGWMLREVGKQNKNVEVEFLSTYYHNMPRTMLRYAIEKFSPAERQNYLKGLI